MAKCVCCWQIYDPDDAEREYDDASYICDNDLEGTYGNFIGYCAQCAISEAMDSYEQGLEDLSYLDDD